MKEEENTPTLLSEEKDSGKQDMDISALIFKYLRYWWLFFISLAIALSIAFLLNRYTVSTYKTTAQLRILQGQENRSMGLQGSGAISLIDGSKSNLDNEKSILRSRKLLSPVVEKLGLNTLYFSEGKITSTELWREQIPFKVEWPEKNAGSPSYSLRFISDNGFKIKITDEEEEIEAEFGEEIELGGQKFVVNPNPEYSSQEGTKNQGKSYLFKHTSHISAVNKLRGGLSIQDNGDDSDILNISYTGPNKKKSEAIVDSVVSVYRKDDITDQQKISRQTQRFIAERVGALFLELDTVESGLVQYKQSNQFISIESAASESSSKEREAEKRRTELEIQKQLVSAFQDQLTSGENYTLLPANLGIDNSSINSLSQAYNQGVLDLNERLISSTSENPVVQNLEAKLDRLKDNILRSIEGYIKDIDLKLENVKSQEEASSGRSREIPETEKGLRNIMREQETKEKLYLFLLEKREESGIQYAVASPTSKIVDYAYTGGGAVEPQTETAYSIALIAGLVVPLAILYLMFLFDKRIRSRNDIEELLPNTPLMAEIPHLIREPNKLIVKNDLRNLAETFRILRTNLSFFKKQSSNEGDGKVIFVTSTIKGEGKTFISLNTAHSLAATGKKTLIIGADLRNPQVHNYYGVDKNTPGVSSYLIDESFTIQDLVHNPQGYFKSLDFMLAGHIPPNPAELLMDDRFGELISEARKIYDYVVVDTAPTLMVTDTQLITGHADITLYVVKADYTESKLLNHVKESIRSKKLRNLGIVFNGVKSRSGYGYGYGYNYNYGYGYGYSAETKKPWWKFWKK